MPTTLQWCERSYGANAPTVRGSFPEKQCTEVYNAGGAVRKSGSAEAGHLRAGILTGRGTV